MILLPSSNEANAGIVCPDSSFYTRETHSVAANLLGMLLVRIIADKSGGKKRLSGIIVETEAYGSSDDPASHAFRGKTPRNSVMFGSVGLAYVYFTYGNHYCVNVSARTDKCEAGAVLIRALQPLEGIKAMKNFRNSEDIFCLTSGPGKLTKALQVTKDLNGVDMTSPDSPLHIEYTLASAGKSTDTQVIRTKRIGISRGAEKDWRYVLQSNPFASRKA